MKDKSLNWLKLTLGVLAVAIVGLIVGMIVINMSSEESLIPEDLNLTIEPDENGYIDISYGQVYDDAKERSDILLKEGSKNVKVVKAIYNKLINDEQFRSENPMYVNHFIIAEADVLAENGFKREALDELLNQDISDLNWGQFELSNYYWRIIKLANELGEKEIEDDYRAKHESEVKVVTL